MILYRKAKPLRPRRAPTPEPPFHCLAAVAPYGTRHGAPLAIDWHSLTITAAPRSEVLVGSSEIELERIHAPLLIDAADRSESVYRRGDELLARAADAGIAVQWLTAIDASLPSCNATPMMVTIGAWPFDLERIAAIFERAAEASLNWGALVPVAAPVTTELRALERLADEASRFGARFVAAAGFECDRTARQEIARTLQLTPDDDRYALLFHGSVEPLLVATERHVAALAEERGMADCVLLPDGEAHTNWNGAVLLVRTASRLLAMQRDVDLAGTLLRSARTLARLDRPLVQIAQSARIAIVGGIDDVAIEILEEWLAGTPPRFVSHVDTEWRVRRDHGV